MRWGFGGNRDDDADEDQAREELEDEQDAEAGGDADEDAGDDDAEQTAEDAALEARIQSEAQKRADEELTKIRAAAQRRGLDWTGSEFGVTDPQRAQQAFGFLGQPAERPQQAATDPEDDTEPELEDWDQESLRKHTAWQIRQATKQMAAENQRLQRMVVDSELSRALDRVDDAVKKHAPHLEEILEHPEFRPSVREALQSQAPELWSDSRNLARIAAMLSVDLDREQIPKKEPPRDESGRFTAGEQQRRQLGVLSPTRDSGRAPDEDLTDGERRFIRQGRFDSAAEVRALRPNQDGITTFEGYEKYLNRQKARARK